MDVFSTKGGPDDDDMVVGNRRRTTVALRGERDTAARHTAAEDLGC